MGARGKTRRRSMTQESICPLSQGFDVNSLRSRIAELQNVDESSELGPEEEEEKLLNNVVRELVGKFNWVLSENTSNLGALPKEDLDEELDEVEGKGENADVESEIKELERRWMEDYDKLESELEKLSCSLEFIESQNPEKANEDMQIEVSSLSRGQADISNEHGSKFKILELSHQTENKKTTLKSLQDIDSIYKRFEVVEKLEDTLTGLRIIEIEENSIRLSLKNIPYLESVLQRQNIEFVIEPLELDHELIIETVEGTWELKNVKIFPNDVYIGEIIDAAKTFRNLYLMFSVIETRSSLEWLVRRVQDRIAVSSIRRFVVKNANKSRHSFEYLDREELLVAHVVGGVDAFIKLPQGWPLSDSALELVSLKSTSQYSKEISLSFHCKIVEVANSLKAHLRQNISSFADRIEEILMQQMRAELN